MTLPVLGALLNPCGDTVRERDLRAIQPGLVVTYSGNRGFDILFRGWGPRTRRGQHTTRLARVVLHNTHEPPLLPKFDPVELHGESLGSLLNEVLGWPRGVGGK